MVLENAMLLKYVRAAQLDILGHLRFGATDACESVLDVIDQTLRHKRVLVQIYQVRCLLRREDADRDAVLFHGDPHFGEYRFALQTDRFGSLQLLLPCFVQF